MTGTTRGRTKQVVQWQPSGEDTREETITPPEDSPPPYYTMYPGSPLRLVRSDQDSKHIYVETKTLTDAPKITVPAWEDKNGQTEEGADTEEGSEGKLKDKTDQKIPIVKLSKEAKERILEKANGARAALSNLLKDFCRKTTAHGFSHVIEEELPMFLRVFWLVVTLISLGALLSVAYSVTKDSFVTKRPFTEVTYRDSRKTGLPLPEITVCSLSRFWKSKMQKYNVSTTLASYLLLAVGGPEVVSSNLKTDTRMVRVFQDDLQSFLQERNLTLSETIALLSPKCEELVVGCYNDVVTLPGNQCCDQMFRPSITTLGQCYSTLGGPNNTSYVQTTGGLIGGTRIIFSIKKDEYMEYDHTIVSSSAVNEVGIHMSLSHFDMTPTVASNIHAVRIAPDTSANIGLSITRIDHSERYIKDWPWSTHYSDCVREEEYRNLTEARQMNTENNFYFTLMYRYCLLLHANCSAIPMRLRDDQTPECMPDQILKHLFLEREVKECVHKNLYHYNNNTNRLCYTTYIAKQLSYTNLKTDTLMELRESPMNSLAMAVVYYSELGYTEYYERIPTFSTWFSDLGGQMGLFLGASFITIVELFFTVCYVIRLALCRAGRAVKARLTTEEDSKSKDMTTD